MGFLILFFGFFTLKLMYGKHFPLKGKNDKFLSFWWIFEKLYVNENFSIVLENISASLPILAVFTLTGTK